ncbi:M20 aminoacylase family protein [Halovulum sp. GXIMD14793]
MPVINRIAEYYDEMKGWRQHLHANPELLYDTVETAAFVVKQLEAFGVDQIETGIGRVGVVGIIKGQGDGSVIGLRADMDALPIQEVRDLPYKSKNEGKMHACGHDGHTTMLLGAAKYLAETRNFAGSVALIFQPAEEGGGGAREMCQDGLMDRFGIAQVYGLHNWPGLAEGEISMNPGATMAAADQFDIVIKGYGAHAAFPQLSIDPIVIGTQIVQALQSIVSRNADPMEAAVVSVTQFHAGSAYNVIPEDARLTGTVRALSEDVRKMIQHRIGEIAPAIAEGFGGTAEVDYRPGYPVTVNDADAVAFAAGVAADVVGEAKASTDWRPQMGAEDFSFMLNERPGAYVFLGQGDTAGLHHPEYDFNDDIAPIGASYFARLVERAQPIMR